MTLHLIESAGDSVKNREDYRCIDTDRTYLCAYDAGHAEAVCETCSYFRNAEGEIYDTGRNF